MKARNSSIELFRILATFLVLFIHFNGWFVGGVPSNFDFSSISSFRIGQLSIQALCACCVNCFILISGYFSIRLKVGSVAKLFIQLVGIFVPFYILDCILGAGSVFSKQLLYNCLPISRGGYFVQCYFMLMILSPILNTWINTSVQRGEKKVICILVLFLFVELWFDCLRNNDNFGINNGYSVLHFCFVYLIGRMIFLYKNYFLRYKRYVWLIGYVVSCLIIVLIYLLGFDFAFDYSNPFTILSGVCLFIPFLYHEFSNRFINWVAKGTFAVYIIQVIDPAYSWLVAMDNKLLINNPYSLYLIKALGVCMLFFAISIIYDKIRDLLTSPMLSRLNVVFDKIDKKLNLV